MTVSAQKGAFGWVGQVAQDDLPAAGDYNTNGMTWHRVLQGDLAMNQDQRPYDNEVGGSLLIPGTYKAAYWSGGRLVLHPRLAVDNAPPNHLVSLLWTYAGTMSMLSGTDDIDGTNTLDGTNVLGSASATVSGTLEVNSGDDVMFFPGDDGANVQFGVDQGDGDDRWLAVRKLTPSGASGYVGETFYNSKVANITITATAGAPIVMEVAFQGSAGDSDTYDQCVLEAFTGIPPATGGWQYSTGKNVDTVPISTKGAIKKGTALSADFKRVQNLRIDLGSGMTPPPQMTIIGQYSPFDYSVLNRPIGLTFDYIWENADLYRQIYYGGVSGTTFDPAPHTSPFFVSFGEPTDVYKLGFFAQTVHWMSEPIGLAGQDLVRMRINGIVSTSTGAEWGLWLAGAGIAAGASAWPT